MRFLRFGAKHKQAADNQWRPLTSRCTTPSGRQGRNWKADSPHVHKPSGFQHGRVQRSRTSGPPERSVGRTARCFRIHRRWIRAEHRQPADWRTSFPTPVVFQHGETYGEETLSLPGVTAGKAYMFIPGQAMIVDKRDTTLEVGSGSVLELSTEERKLAPHFRRQYRI